MKPMLLLALFYLMFAPGSSWSQTSRSGDPQFPDNYTSMKRFNLISNYNGLDSPMQMYFKRLPGVSPDYRLGPEDVLRIDVTGNESFSQNYRVTNSGYITFPFLGDLRVEDLTAEELESEIAARLKDLQLINDPEVLVYIESYSSKPIYVLGDVDLPGVYMITQHLTLMDVIFMAGGLDLPAARYGFLHRRAAGGTGAIPYAEQLPMLNVPINRAARQDEIMKNPEIAGPGTEVIRIDLDPAKRGGFIEPNPPLKAGDVFIIPRKSARMFYLIGDVVKPGVYKTDPDTPLLVSQAISYAGGPSKTAKTRNGLLVRYTPTGERQESKIDYFAILKGEQKDFEVLANDIIFIPGSNVKTLSYGLLGILPESIPTQMGNRD